MKRNDSERSDRHAVLKAMLEERRRDIQSRLRSLRETLPALVDEVKDEEEQSVADFVQDVELALVQMKSETLARIDEAVRRLEDGTYGRCLDCGAEIPEARLRALPFAACCLPCQESEETRREAQQRTQGESRLGRAL
jgi:DnaK suppressor protein